jgi:predicted SAM-dependent methyltransferase
MKSILKKILPNYILTKYREVKPFIEYLNFKTNIQKLRKNNKKIFVIVGAGPTKYEGWLSTNYPWFDLLKLETFEKYFKSREVEKILAEHVFEHLTLEDGKKAIQNLKRILKPGGTIRIAVPDGYNPDKNFINWIKPNGTGPGADDHKVLFNYKLIKEILDEDFKIKYLEYFDEDGEFIYNNWSNDKKNGYIMRSRYEDKRNTDKEIRFNSIILDATIIN